MPQTSSIIVTPRALERVAAARAWLEAIQSGTPALVLASSPEAGDDLLRGLVDSRGAIFAIERMTLNRLVGLLAAPRMASEGLAPAAGLANEAVAARALFGLRGDPCLEYFAPVLERPGFAAALAPTLNELRLAGVTAAQLERLDARGRAMAALLERFGDELREARLLDRAEMIAAATTALTTGVALGYAGIPTLLFDVPLEAAAERDFVATLALRSPSILATAPAGDERSIRLLSAALRVAPATLSLPIAESGGSSLFRIQDHLFANSAPPERPLDDTVVMRSAASEMQECVEIARQIQIEAKSGTALDHIAVLLHSTRYGAHLEEALARASIPAWFARGSSHPEPGGRALLALLNCAAENFSARRFAEYLALAQTPDDIVDASGAPNADANGAPFVPSETDLGASPLRLDLELPEAMPEADAIDPLPETTGVSRAPWRWENLLVDAAVVGGRERWEVRLDGLASELELRRGELADDDTRVRSLDRQLNDLRHLRATALPLIGALAALPARASWAEWLIDLRDLVGRAIRDCEPVLAALAELEPMGPVGPITLDEVRLVLAERVGRLERRPARRRYGAVFVAPTAYARGLTFDVVMVPGLAERVLPRKLTEDPVLPDSARASLDAGLARQTDRVAIERLALRLVAGAATRRVYFSYPRIDPDQGRPRVPSFYALEILRAAEGRLPGFDELARRAAGDRVTRLGWPAPENPADAIDDIEFDLAVLDRLIDVEPATTIGAAHYLLGANLHLARALRARARRWLRLWTPNDGLVNPSAAEREALAIHQLAARSYSPTALQNFAACPYRFFLQAIHRLEPREEMEPLEVIDPLTRGALFHEVQFQTLTALRSAGALPLAVDNLAVGYDALERELAAVAAEYHDRLAPAIEHVWLDGIDSIRADLREWMRRMVDDGSGYRPERFELAFGLTDRRHRKNADPASVDAPVALEAGIQLRGAIDLIERTPSGALRATDHKTGRVRAERDFVIGGGKTLQPVLYALVAERLLGQPVETGRLYYCTAAGGYEERVVPLNDFARAAIVELAQVVGGALAQGFMPAAPDEGECRWCDYRRVCGPHEELRVRRKTAANGVEARLKGLRQLREHK